MDFTERLELYLEGGMIDEDDVKDINNVCSLFLDDYGVELSEENAGMFIAHLCAAFSRNKTHEPVDELPEEVTNELKSLDTYKQSLEILDKIKLVIKNDLNDVEQAYALLHINNLIATFMQLGLWQTNS